MGAKNVGVSGTMVNNLLPFEGDGPEMGANGRSLKF
jgi:hypothetical protein